MAEQLNLFDMAECLKGNIKMSSANMMRDVGSSRSGVTGENSYDMIKRLSDNLPEGLKESMRTFRSALKKFKGSDDAGSIFFNNILWNPTTLERNSIGNFVELVMESSARGLKGLAKGDVNQAMSQFSSFTEGWRRAWTQAGKGWANGRPQALLEESKFLGEASKLTEPELMARGDVKGIKGIYKAIPRMMANQDDFFTTLGYHMSAQDLVYAEAVKRAGKGGKGAIQSEVIKLLNNMPDDISRQAMVTARRNVFRDMPTNKLHKMILDKFTGLQEIPGARFVVPFVRTPINLGVRSLEYTPLNMMYGFGQMIAKGNGKGQMNAYRGMMGTGLMTAFGGLAYDGVISGDGANLTPGERSAKMAAGWQPNAIKIGKKWYSYRSLGPITSMMTIAGNVGERAKDTGFLDMQTYFKDIKTNVVTDTIKGVLDSTFLPSVTELMTAAVYPDRYGEKGANALLRTVRSQFIPSAVPSLMRAVDPTIRDKAEIGEQLTSPLSTLAGGQPRLGLFGEELKRTGAFTDNFIDIFMNPARATKVANDPLILEVARLQDVGIEGSGFMPPSINDRSLGFKEDTLSKEEIFLGSRAKGFVQRSLMEKILESPNYANLDDTLKLRLLRKMYDKAGRITNLRIRNLKRQAKPLTYREIVQGFE